MVIKSLQNNLTKEETEAYCSENRIFYFENEKFNYDFTSVGAENPEFPVFSQIFEENLRKNWWKINKNDIVIDVGAGFGSYTLSALSLGASMVIAIEPGKDEFLNLCSSLILNPFPGKYFCLPILVNDNETTKSKYFPSTHSCILDKLDDIEQESEDRIQSTITTLVYYFGLPKVDWIKVDVEGYELEVLKGSKEVLEKFSPKLLIENHVGYRANIKDLVQDFLIPLGYIEKENIASEGMNDNWSLWEKPMKDKAVIELISPENPTEKQQNQPNYFFPRGKGPLASILFPTRGRPTLAARAIDSFVSLASDPNNVEFLLKIDEDDQPTIDMYEKLQKFPIQIKADISPRGRGYLDIHTWTNKLASMSSADWILIGNDDATMATQDWDKILLEMRMDTNSPWHGCTDIAYFLLQTVGRPDATEFGFLRRSVIDILGYYSLNVHSDTWIMSVLSGVSSAFRIPMFMKHENEKDKVREEALEVYKIAGRNLNTCESYRKKAKDTLKLVDYVEKWQRERGIFREITP